jgi:hypothetical protein
MRHYILAVDPGKATGLAYFRFEKGEQPTMIWSQEVQFETYAEPIREVMSYDYANNESKLHVVCERFTINAQTTKNSQAPFSLEEIGVLKQLMLDAGYSIDDLVFQSPADAKAMFDNPKLKKLELWHRGGEGHALDAIRHGALYMIKLGWNPLDKLRA